MTQENPDGTTLPPNVQRLWGLEPQRAARTGLTVERVVRAAIEVADAEGLAAVSMARVAKQLDYTTMALYRHVDSKEELLELMLDAIADDPPAEILAAERWREGLELWTRSMLGILRGRQWAVDLPVSGIPTGPRQLAWVETGMRVLRDTPLTDEEKFNTVTVLAGYVRGEATLNRDLRRGVLASGREWHEAELDWTRHLAVVLDPERYPELTEMVAGWMAAPAEPSADTAPTDDFSFGLARFMDGVELLIQRRTAGEGQGTASEPAWRP